MKLEAAQAQARAPQVKFDRCVHREPPSACTAKRVVSAIAAIAALAVLHAAAHAQSAAEFYKGRRMTLITAASPGGGYDQYARLLAVHLPRHIPGEPTLVVQNMSGAEGLRAANYVNNVAAQDGSVIGGLSRNAGLVKLYGFEASAVQFDPQQLHWLGSPQQEIGLVIINARTGVKAAADLKGRELTLSSLASNSPTSIYSRMLNATFGTRLRPVEGYPGSQEALLAVERHEVDGHISGGSSAPFRARIRPWLESGQSTVLLQMGMKRDRSFPDVPTVIELLEQPQDRALFEIGFVEQVMGRPFMVAPKVPADRVATLRAAFDATMKDKDFLAHAQRDRMEIDPVDGATINALIDKAHAAPLEIISRVRALVR